MLDLILIVSDVPAIIARAADTAIDALDQIMMHICLDIAVMIILTCILSSAAYKSENDGKTTIKLRGKISTLHDEIHALKFAVRNRDKRIKELIDGEDKLLGRRDELLQEIYKQSAHNTSLRQTLNKHNFACFLHNRAMADKEKKICALEVKLAGANRKIAELNATPAQTTTNGPQDQTSFSRWEAKTRLLEEAAVEAQKARDVKIAEHEAEIHAINQAAETMVQAASAEAWESASSRLSRLRSELDASEAARAAADGDVATWRREAESAHDQAKKKADEASLTAALVAELRSRLALSQQRLQAADNQAAAERAKLVQEAEEALATRTVILNKTLGDKTTQIFKLEAKIEEGKVTSKNQISLLQEQIRRTHARMEEINEDSMCKGEELQEFAERDNKQRTQIKELRAQLTSFTTQTEAQQRAEIVELKRQLEEKMELDRELLNASDEETEAQEEDEDDGRDYGPEHDDNSQDSHDDGNYLDEAYDSEQDAEAVSDHEYE